MDKGDPNVIKFCLTALFCTRSFKSPLNPDYSSITTGEKEIDVPENLLEFLHSQDLSKILIKHSIGIFKPHLTTTMGPNGPALGTSLDDLNALPDSLVQDLESIVNDENGDLGFYLDRRPAPSLGYTKKSSRLGALAIRRLQPIEDKEGKTRIVAMFDY